MKKSILILIPLMLNLFFWGCTHRINITPDLNKIEQVVDTKINKNVGYFISKDNLSKKVVNRLMGGDAVKYAPYNEVEPVLRKALSNVFANVFYIQ